MWYVQSSAGSFVRTERLAVAVRRAITFHADDEAEVNIQRDGRHAGTLTYGGFWRISDPDLNREVDKVLEA